MAQRRVPRRSTAKALLERYSGSWRKLAVAVGLPASAANSLRLMSMREPGSCSLERERIVRDGLGLKRRKRRRSIVISDEDLWQEMQAEREALGLTWTEYLRSSMSGMTRMWNGK